MSRGVKAFYYCLESKWDMDCMGQWNIRWDASYIDAAKEIAKELDDQDGEPQERRQFWLKQDDHDTPMLMDIYTELNVEYYASISKGAQKHE
jgi:hypothetical protein